MLILPRIVQFKSTVVTFGILPEKPYAFDKLIGNIVFAIDIFQDKDEFFKSFFVAQGIELGGRIFPSIT